MMIREASSRDIPLLALHHRKMFEEIWDHKGERLDPGRALALEQAYAEKLLTEFDSGLCKCWVIEQQGAIVASGGITMGSYVPNPENLSYRGAYLHSIYTEAGCRKQNLAKSIVEHAIAYCQANGIYRMLLHSSEAGRPLYRKLGFIDAPETMRLVLR